MTRDLEGGAKEGGIGSERETVMVADDRHKELNVDQKWDAMIDLTLRRFVYSTAGGAAVALALFRGPTARWSAIAFGAGLGLGTAIRDSSQIFNGANSAWPLDFKVADQK